LILRGLNKWEKRKGSIKEDPTKEDKNSKEMKIFQEENSSLNITLILLRAMVVV